MSPLRKPNVAEKTPKTVRCYFEGRKELFEGLYIYNKEKEWRKYPVIRLDLSNGKYYEKERVHPTINVILEQQERRFGITNPADSTNYDARLTRLIIRNSQKFFQLWHDVCRIMCIFANCNRI